MTTSCARCRRRSPSRRSRTSRSARTRPSRPRAGGGAGSGSGGGSALGGSGTTTTTGGGNQGNDGLAGTVSADDPSSIPTPLLILGGLALLLVAAGAAGLIAKRIQARRPGT